MTPEDLDDLEHLAAGREGPVAHGRAQLAGLGMLHELGVQSVGVNLGTRQDQPALVRVQHVGVAEVLADERMQDLQV